MKAIVLGCVTTVKVDSLVSQIKKTQNQEIPYMGPLDLVIILDRKVVPIYDNVKFNIECMNILERMKVNYRYVDNGEVIEISKRDLLPIDAIGDLILTEDIIEVDNSTPDEFTELHKMLSEYRKESNSSISLEKSNTIPEILSEDNISDIVEFIDMEEEELRF